MSPDECIGAIAAGQHGVITRAQCRRAGLTAHAIAHRRGSGRWVDLHRGVYAISGTPLTAHQRIIAAVFSLGPRAVASATTAAWLHEVIDEPPSSVHVSLPPGQHRRARRGLVITEAPLRRADIQRVCNIPVTRIDRTIVDIAGVIPIARLEAALDAALVRRMTTVSKLRTYVHERHLAHRRGARALRELLDDRATGVPESELERAFLRRVRASGLPMPIRQHRIGERRIDFAFLAQRIAIELDGLRHHTASAFRRDRRRQNELVLLGWTPLRFTWDDVTREWSTVHRTLTLALGLADS